MAIVATQPAAESGVAQYPICRWYRSVKAAHPTSFLKYI